MKNRIVPADPNNPNGLHLKYLIRKIIGVKGVPNSFGHRQRYITKAVDPENEYFVLRLDFNGDKAHARACRVALHKYAEEIEPLLPELANDLRKRYPLPL